jgi:tetratricopeptide (TPR) repeat protein
LEKIPFLAMAAGVGAATLAARFDARGLWEPPPTLAQFGIGARIMQACYVWVYYIWKPVFPSGLSPVYTTLLGFNPSAPLFVFSLIVVVTLTGLLIWQRRRWPAALALWISHVCLLAPMTGFTERAHYVNDRYSYLQGVLLALGIAALLGRSLLMSYHRWATAATVVVIGSFVVSTLAQLRIWRDSEALFAFVYRTTSYTPTRADIAFRLGDAVRIKGRTAEASQYYRESLRLVPTGQRAAVPHFGLGMIAQSESRSQEAADHFQAAIRLDPEFAEAYLALGGILVQAGRAADALPFLKRGAALQPANADARELLGVALFQTREFGASVAEFAAASRLRPESAPLLCNLASALIAAGRVPEALAYSQRATELNPASAEAFMSLGDALRLSGRGSEAIDALREAVRRKPMLPAAHNLLGTALATSGRLAEAVAAFREATRLDPTFVLAHFNLGLALRDSGDLEEARKAFSTALRLQPDYVAARDELARLPTR